MALVFLQVLGTWIVVAEEAMRDGTAGASLLSNCDGAVQQIRMKAAKGNVWAPV
jgi:hypothetical protein